MKINTKEMSYDEMLKLPRLQHKKPMMPQVWLATVVRIAIAPTLWKTKFSYTTERMDLVGDQPCLILMNHCSFTDMKLAYGIFLSKKIRDCYICRCNERNFRKIDAFAWMYTYS